MGNIEPVIKFQSFSSGSCGNCYFLHAEVPDGRSSGIIIDAGVSLRRLRQELLKGGFTFDDIDAVLVTHDHWDHIHNLGSYCKRLLKPVWMTGVLRRSMATHYLTGQYLGPVAKQLKDDGWSEIVPGTIRAKYFIVPHDATQTVGYFIDLAGYGFTVMTDIGAITEEALDYARQSSTVVIEANYDLDMLRSGPYPVELQDRICGGHGHLSNAETADAISDFLHPGLRNIFLCHLSEHNNTPALAVKTTSRAVEGTGIRLLALPRQTASPLFVL